MARRASAREFREGTLLWKPLEERKVGANVSRYLPALAERHQGPGLRLLRGLVAVVGERPGSFLEEHLGLFRGQGPPTVYAGARRTSHAGCLLVHRR
jgi:hypothetical protein